MLKVKRKNSLRRLLAAALLTSALPLTAAACGVCIEDKVAATYDFEVVNLATRNGHTVLFYELVGPVVQDPKTEKMISAAAAQAAGVEHDSVRVSLQQAALSVAIDTKRASPAEMKNRIEQKLRPWRLGLKLLRTIVNGKLSAPT